MNPEGARVFRVLTVVQERKGRLGEEEAAASLFLSPDRFRAVFLAEMGMGFRAYCCQIKLKNAQALLQDSGHSIQDVADALSYSSRSAFEHWFKRHTSMWPAQYRKTTTLSIDARQLTPVSSAANSAMHSGEYR
jgi:transcriptional regulator GlxA family with amidase domain